MCETNASISRGSFDDGASRLDPGSDHEHAGGPLTHNLYLQPLLLCIPNKSKGSTVLDTTTRVLELCLAINLVTCLFRQSLEINLARS